LVVILDDYYRDNLLQVRQILYSIIKVGYLFNFINVEATCLSRLPSIRLWHCVVCVTIFKCISIIKLLLPSKGMKAFRTTDKARNFGVNAKT